jgi:branched-subunit amino acid transport protein
MMSRDLPLIVGMAAVTALPRLLPVFLAGRFTPPRFVRLWLESVPYAALGALIVPGIFDADPMMPMTGAAAGSMAVVVAMLRPPAYVTALAAIAAAALVKALV